MFRIPSMKTYVKPVNRTLNSMDFLLDYQQKILKYTDSEKFLTNRLLLLYMDTGTGKSLTAISIAAQMLNNNRIKQVVVLTPKIIQDEFLKQFYKFCGYSIFG